MKLTPLTGIVGANILIHLAASGLIGASMGSTGGYGPAWGWGVLISGLFLIAGNIALSIVFLILAGFTKGDSSKTLGKLSQGFILSAGVVLLMSVPMCLMSLAT